VVVIDDIGLRNLLQQAAYEKWETRLIAATEPELSAMRSGTHTELERPAGLRATRDGVQVQLDAGPAVEQQ